jgi:hypothetical protein
MEVTYYTTTDRLVIIKRDKGKVSFVNKKQSQWEEFPDLMRRILSGEYDEIHESEARHLYQQWYPGKTLP